MKHFYCKYSLLIVILLTVTLLVAAGCTSSISHDGGKYTGDLKDDIPQGTGKWTGPDGTIYEGEFENGVAQSTDTVTLPDGIIYEGELKNYVSHMARGQ